MLKVDNLQVSYGHIEVLKGISFSVDIGEIVALIGGNGAGKTTTLSTISGLVRPRSGTIAWKGENIQNAAVEAIAKTYAINIRHSQCTVSQATAKTCVVHLREVPHFLDSHHIGVFEGTLDYAGVKGGVLIASHSATSADLLLEWT